MRMNIGTGLDVFISPVIEYDIMWLTGIVFTNHLTIVVSAYYAWIGGYVTSVFNWDIAFLIKLNYFICFQTKEMSLIRNTILECQVCGKWWRKSLEMADQVLINMSEDCCDIEVICVCVSLCLSGFHEPQSRCHPNPCYNGVSCMESTMYPGYQCGPCPEGMTGNGTHCQDIDEVPADSILILVLLILLPESCPCEKVLLKRVLITELMDFIEYLYANWV